MNRKSTRPTTGAPQSEEASSAHDQATLAAAISRAPSQSKDIELTDGDLQGIAGGTFRCEVFNPAPN